MSVKFGKNSHELTCDECERRPEYYFGDWKVVWERAVQDGWTGEKDKTGAWVHRCPKCNEPLKKEQDRLKKRRENYKKKKRKAKS